MVSKSDMRGLFQPAKNKRLAKIISIETPAKFRTSIKKLMEGGLTSTERKALILARTRAMLQLRRKNLSPKERREFTMISKMNIPKASSKKIMMMKKNTPRRLKGFGLYTGGVNFRKSL